MVKTKSNKLVERSKTHLGRSRRNQNGQVTPEKPPKIAARNHGKTSSLELCRLGTSVLLSDHDGLRYFVNKMAEVSIASVDPLIL